MTTAVHAYSVALREVKSLAMCTVAEPLAIAKRVLELEAETVNNVAKQAGFESRLKDTPRSLQLDLTAPGRQSPLLLFDAALKLPL